MTGESDDRQWMTPLLNRIAAVIGYEAATTLGVAKAGQQIYIPKVAHPDHWLSRLLGNGAAQMLCTEFGDRNLVIPPALAGDRRRRATAIAELIRKGYSNNQIAGELGVSLKTVTRHRQKAPDERQGSLF